jgi:hypothetical protein
VGVGSKRHAFAALAPGKGPGTIAQEAGLTPGPVWRGAENLAPTGIRSPDRPARSESLYRLRYSGLQKIVDTRTRMSVLFCLGFIWQRCTQSLYDHDPCIKALYTTVAPTNAHKYTKISFIHTPNAYMFRPTVWPSSGV